MARPRSAGSRALVARDHGGVRAGLQPSRLGAERGRSRASAAAVDPAAEGVRTCAGCGKRVPSGRDVLVRVVFGPAGAIAIDGGEGSFGRGAYVHPSVECVRVGGARGLARRRPKGRAERPEGQPEQEATSAPLEGLTIDDAPLTAESLRRAVVAAYQRRLEGLLSAARRSRSIVHGADAVCAALEAGDAALVVVATDAAAAANRTEVRAAVSAGRAVAWGTKQELGELADAGREDGVAVVAILDPGIGLAAGDAVRVMDTLRVPFADTVRRSSEGADVPEDDVVRTGLVERRA